MRTRAKILAVGFLTVALVTALLAILWPSVFESWSIHWGWIAGGALIAALGFRVVAEIV